MINLGASNILSLKADHVLPKGFVCDNCNQYFAIKIEKVLLEQPHFKHLRGRSKIENKKRKIPTLNIMAIGSKPMNVELSFDKKEGLSIAIPNDNAKYFSASSTGKLIIPIISAPEENNLILSKFLAKIASEALIYSVLGDKALVEELWNYPGLDKLKQYARYGRNINFWPYHQRRIYPEGARFKDSKSNNELFEILHEFTFIHTDDSSIHLIVCIMGIEYAINMNTPETSSYSNWLTANSNRSPLEEASEAGL